MKPVLSIQELTKVKTFGTNVLITEAIAKVEEALITRYALDAKKATFHLVRENPIKEGAEQHSFIYLQRTNQKENKALFEKLEQGAFHSHGDLNSDLLKEELLPLYSAHVTEKLGYGEDAELVETSHHGDTGTTSIRFKSTKTYKVYDEYGEVTEVKRTVPHHASWKLVDPAVDYPNIVVIPRNLFANSVEFIRLFTKAVGVDAERIHITQNPTIPGVEKVDVHFNSTDLVYAGSLPVSIIPHGDEVRIYNKVTGAIVAPEGGEPTEENPPVDPVTPPEGGDGEDTGKPEPEPTLQVETSIDAASRTITILSENAASASVTIGGETFSGTAENGVIEIVLGDAIELLAGAELVITVDAVNASIPSTTVTHVIRPNEEISSVVLEDQQGEPIQDQNGNPIEEQGE